MLGACEAALPASVAVLAAAVGDWRVARVGASKIKKQPGEPAPHLALVANPDLLARLSAPGPARPRLVIGFAAETDNILNNAAAKRLRKGCDWILANDVGHAAGIMGGDENRVHLISEAGTEDWPRSSKRTVAERLAARIAHHLEPDRPAEEHAS